MVSHDDMDQAIEWVGAGVGRSILHQTAYAVCKSLVRLHTSTPVCLRVGN